MVPQGAKMEAPRLPNDNPEELKDAIAPILALKAGNIGVGIHKKYIQNDLCELMVFCNTFHSMKTQKAIHV